MKGAQMYKDEGVDFWLTLVCQPINSCACFGELSDYTSPLPVTLGHGLCGLVRNVALTLIQQICLFQFSDTGHCTSMEITLLVKTLDCQLIEAMPPLPGKADIQGFNFRARVGGLQFAAFYLSSECASNTELQFILNDFNCSVWMYVRRLCLSCLCDLCLWILLVMFILILLAFKF